MTLSNPITEPCFTCKVQCIFPFSNKLRYLHVNVRVLVRVCVHIRCFTCLYIRTCNVCYVYLLRVYEIVITCKTAITRTKTRTFTCKITSFTTEGKDTLRYCVLIRVSLRLTAF